MPESSPPRKWLDVSVDRVRCCGYAVCVGLSPEVFDLDEDGLARVRDRRRPRGVGGFRPARRGPSRPESAIVVVTDGSPGPSNGYSPS